MRISYEEAVSRCWAEVNLTRLVENYKNALAHLAKTTQLICVLKADAYGLGLPVVAKRLWQEGQRMFAVASFNEAQQLLGAVPEAEVLRLVECFREGKEYTRSLDVTEEQEKAVRTIADLERAIVDFEGRIKQYKAQQEALTGSILDFMRKNNKTKWVISDELSFTRIEPSVRQTVDSARLKKEMPEVYSAFLKESTVKESLRINIK
jgi:hypothetical protein